MNYLVVVMVWCTIAASLLGVIDGAKILGLFPFIGKSHSIVNLALAQELARRGHEVTVVGVHPLQEPLANYTDIVLNTNLFQIMQKSRGTTNLFDRSQTGTFNVAFMMWNVNEIVCDRMLEEEAMQKLIHSTDLKFDLIIMEAFFNECFLGFVHKFKAPLIQICTFGGTPWMGDWVGNPSPYAYVPDPFLSFNDRMNLWERTHNTLMATFWKVGRQYYYLPKQDAVLKKYFGHLEDLPSVSEIEYNTSLLFVNHHFSLSYPRPMVPNYVQVGGMHIKPPKPLPKDLKEYLDNAKDGVVYFSMGSNLRSAELPAEKKNAFLEAFSKLKQKVLWKWEEDTLPGKPSNVKLGKWLPQSDILAHPNVRVFMTHGGLLSTQEAINRGVPLVGIPVFGDQKLNMARAASAGFGVVVSLENITAESVTWALNQVLQNPSYKDNVKRMSAIYRDQPLTPLEQAVYWTEYVVRHKGATHMRSAALDLAWYQYFLLDVIAVLLFASASVVFVVFILLRAMVQKCWTGKTRVPKRSKVD